MIKKKLFRYLGRNGNITTFICLDGVDHIPMFRLEADKGKILTDGTQFVYSISIFADDVDKWSEVDDPNADKINK